jgi:hypothetical protein
MENIQFFSKSESIFSYDLKGAKINRFLKECTEIGLDKNFIIDFNSEPILLNEI